MKVIVVDFEGTDGYFDFSTGFNIKTDIVRSYYSWAAALKCPIVGLPYLKHNMLDVNIIICIIKSIRSIDNCIKILKLFKFDKIVFTYKDDLDRFSSDILDVEFINKFVKLSEVANTFIYSHNATIGILSALIECESKYCPIGGAFDELQHTVVDYADRKGVLVGQFCKRKARCVPLSIILASKVAEKLNQQLTVVSNDVSFASKFIKQNVRIIPPLKYYDWIKLIARQKCIIDLDHCFTPGQILVDCSLVGIPCFGTTNDGGSLNFYDDCRSSVDSIVRKNKYSYRQLTKNILQRAKDTISINSISLKLNNVLRRKF